MSVAGISSSNLFSYGSQYVQGKMQQMQQEFKQLGTDLQSGNLAAAQSDFASLQQLNPQSTSSSSSTSQTSSPIAQAFTQLSKDLQSGNLSAAQQDYSTIQQDMQSQSSQAHGHHHHHGGGGSSSQESSVNQLFTQLGQALQSGSLSSAQQLYSTLQQEFQQVGTNLQPPANPGPNAVSVNA